VNLDSRTRDLTISCCRLRPTRLCPTLRNASTGSWTQTAIPASSSPALTGLYSRRLT
ncbi:unnamed protein product, partial [Lampetra planeri]